MRKCIYFLITILILFAACAHKAPPLFKDRMKPKLVRVKALNNRQVQLSFSEDLDTLSISTNSIFFHTDSDTLDIIALYPSLSAAEIMCLTEPQAPLLYHVTGTVYDTAQNTGNIESTFEGTILPDTMPPYVAQYSRGFNKRMFVLGFSEPMDTSKAVYIILPDIAMTFIWTDLRTGQIAPQDPADSLTFGVTYYLYLPEALQDVSGNQLPPFITSITPDTVDEPLVLKGEVKVNDTLVTDGIAVLKKDEPIGVCFISSGLFSFDVREPEAYTIEAVSDGFYGTGVVWSDSVNAITLFPSEKTVDSIIR